MANENELVDFPHLERLSGLSSAELTRELDALTAIARTSGAKAQKAAAEAVALIQETHRARQAR